MNTIRDVYSVAHHIDDYGITGYHVDNKYVDLQISAQALQTIIIK